MIICNLNTIKLTHIPNIKVLLLKALLKKSSFHLSNLSTMKLPLEKFYYNNVVFDEEGCKRYHQVVDWDDNSEFVHPCYLHSLAFPLHLKLLLLPEFVFPLMGLVHVKNKIKQVRPIKKSEKLQLCSSFEQLKVHPKGWLFSIRAEFFSGNEAVWESVSTNLFRTQHSHVVVAEDKPLKKNFANPVNTTWHLNSNLGRRYANVSGDFNPIHLSKWSAKMLGFKQHIIHGMWTKSYCISELQKVSPLLFEQAFEINTLFKRPLYLPGQVIMATQRFELKSADNEQQFTVQSVGVNDQEQPLHLIGNIRAI
jgi:acyl dehydratase